MASVLFYLAWGPTAVFFWAGSVLIDVDHYYDYLHHNRFSDFNIRRMFAYHNEIATRLYKRPEFLNLSILHTVEFLLPLYLAALWLDSFALKAMVFGCLFHIGLDLVDLYKKKIFFLRCFSVVDYIIRKRQRLGRGMDPTGVYRDAVQVVREKNVV
jgi:hypothetical protein